MRLNRKCLIATSVLLLSPLAACQSTPATSCAGFRLNNLTAAGTVALIQADRAGAERVVGNDQNFARRGCE